MFPVASSRFPVVTGNRQLGTGNRQPHMGDVPSGLPRRELRTREKEWPRALARRLASLGITPNAVSIASVFIAIATGAALYAVAIAPERAVTLLFLLAAIGIQLRLLSNLLDGLLAVEGGMKSALGDIYNDLPDRIADSVILVGAGYATGGIGLELGWLAALLAMMTAYVRTLAGSIGATPLFLGPLAKQHRMFVLTLGCLIAAVDFALTGSTRAVLAALVVIVVGSAVTVVRRTVVMARELKRR